MYPVQADQKDRDVNKHPFKMKLKPFSHHTIYEQGENERHSDLRLHQQTPIHVCIHAHYQGKGDA